jgi:glucose/arabinose dehydrogenase
VQHARDQLYENWPKHYTREQGAELPAETMFRVMRGGDYGWPYCYYDGKQDRHVLAPEYGGDGRKTDRCSDKPPPEVAYPAHWAPNALLFYTGNSFPQRYIGGAFIAFHGSWNRPVQQGYNVVFQPLDAAGKPRGNYEVFADGFAGRVKDPVRAAHRPSGLAMGPDGALYIGDDQRGRIWKVIRR